MKAYKIKRVVEGNAIWHLPEDKDMPSGEYYPAAKVRALVEAAEALLEFTDSDGDGPLVINDYLDKLKAALKETK